MFEDVPVVGGGLAHASGGDEFGYEDGEEAMGVEKTQALGCAVWIEDGVEFVVDAFGCDKGKQCGVTYDEAFGPCIYIEVVAHHEAYGAKHAQRVVTEDFAINCFQAVCCDIGGSMQGVDKDFLEAGISCI